MPKAAGLHLPYAAVLVIFFVMTLLVVVARPLVLLLLTEKWLGAVPFLRVFCFAYMFDSICRLNNNMLFVKGWSGLFLWLEVIKKAVVTPFFLLAIPYGPLVICYVVVLHTVVDITCSTYCLRKYLGIDLWGMFVRGSISCVRCWLAPRRWLFAGFLFLPGSRSLWASCPPGCCIGGCCGGHSPLCGAGDYFPKGREMPDQVGHDGRFAGWGRRMTRVAGRMTRIRRESKCSGPGTPGLLLLFSHNSP